VSSARNKQAFGRIQFEPKFQRVMCLDGIVRPGQKREARLRADVTGIHILKACRSKDLDGRELPGHDRRCFNAIAPICDAGVALPWMSYPKRGSNH